MTADSTTKVREALAERLQLLEPAWPKGRCLNRADAALAALVEHRDDLLDLLGMEQVGWTDPSQTFFASSLNDPSEMSADGWSPLYAFRPKEQP